MVKVSLAVLALLSGSAAAWTVTPVSMKADVPSTVASRRDLFAKGAALVTAVAGPALVNAYDLPDLPYPYEALEPFIDAPTMKFHHDKHHATYVANLNKATEGKDQPPLPLLQANALSATVIRNNGGGHYNHAFFWDELSPPDEAKKSSVSPALQEAINKAFGSTDEMKSQFNARAAPGALFGSGWVWVCATDSGDLKIVGTPNQDNPLMRGVFAEVMYPILGLDVWEHAYYLKYQNRRPEYVSNFWNLVNWSKVSENYDYVTKNYAGVSVRG